MILAGDIGGTNARLALFGVGQNGFQLVSVSIFPSRDYKSLDEIVQKFVETVDARPEKACFGVAGPVRNGRVETSNLPWVIESQKLADELKIGKALLINDLEANAWGIAALDPSDIVTLSHGKGGTGGVGNRCVIAAGTGLGEAGMFWDGKEHQIFACEGGHTEFGPRNELEIDLLRYLQGRYGHVSYERIVSGPGLVNVFEFLRDTGRGKQPDWMIEEMAHSDPAAVISRAGMDNRCPLSVQALDLFVAIYGAEAGNLALKIMANGGVFVSGGIAPKIISKIAGPLFMDSFRDKGRMRPVVEAMPIHVITNDKVALLGAARCAMVRST